jgi:hypothetical protein
MNMGFVPSKTKLKPGCNSNGLRPSGTFTDIMLRQPSHTLACVL